MGLPITKITRGQGGITVTPSTQDGISGLVIYDSTLTEGKGVISSLADANDLGFEYDETSGAVESVLGLHFEEFYKYSDYQCYYIIKNTVDTTAYDELQQFAKGAIRIFGVYDNISADFTISLLASAQTGVKDLDVDRSAPANVIYTATSTQLDTFFTTTSAGSGDSFRVQAYIGQDSTAGTTKTATLLDNGADFVGGIGHALGIRSFLNVFESMAWRGKVNMTATTVQPYLVNGTDVSTLSKSEMDSIVNNKWNFLYIENGVSGVYFATDDTATQAGQGNASYGKLSLSGVWDKAFRTLKVALNPYVSSPVYFKKDGTIAPITIKDIQQACDTNINEMRKAGEISDYSIVIDPNQNVLETGILYVTINIIPVGEAEEINVTLGFVTQL